MHKISGITFLIGIFHNKENIIIEFGETSKIIKSTSSKKIFTF